MIGRPGSIVWLLAAEMRLGFRDSFGRGGARRIIVFAIAVLMLIFVFGLPFALLLQRHGIPVSPLSVLLSDAVLVFVGALMLSQTLAAATLALYARGDLDLLFSAPISPRKVLAARFAAIAANAFAGFGLLVGAPLLPVAVLGHWQWLGTVVVLADLALVASAGGLLLATGLFGILGPRRTRTVAQILAAVIGSAIFLAAQARNLLGGPRTEGLWFAVAQQAGRIQVPPGASWPLRAMLGQPLPLAGITVASVAVFAAASQWLGERFSRNAAAAGGIDLAGSKPTRQVRERPFAEGAFRATFDKELRLLWRDAALLSQVLLRVLYLLPLAFVMLREAHGHMVYLLPAGAAALSMMTGQVAGSLAWVTVAAEDSPELLAAAPAPVGLLLRAKLAAALTPVAVLLAAPLVFLLGMSPQVGLAAVAGCAASAVASALINTWYNKPARRTDFRRRRGGSFVGAFAQFLVTAVISAAAAVAAIPGVWALLAVIPALMALGGLLALRRTDEQIAEAMRTPA